MRKERRSARRVVWSCEVECQGPQPDPLRPQMRDLSATGAFIESASPAPIGTLLSLRFSVPGGDVVATAEVARVVPEGMGVRFLDLTPADQRLVDEAIAQAPDAP